MNDGADRERLLDEVLAGDVDVDAAEVVARCARDPEFAAALAELLQVQRRLAARGAMVREDLATPAPELEGAAERAMRTLVAGHPVRRRPVWPWLAAVVAAAAITMTVVMWTRSPNLHDQVLGTFPVVAIADRTLQFRHVLARNEHFIVTVLDGKRVVFTSDRLFAPTWRPNADLVDIWQPSWSVKVVTEGGDIEPSYGRVLEDWDPRR